MRWAIPRDNAGTEEGIVPQRWIIHGDHGPADELDGVRPRGRVRRLLGRSAPPEHVRDDGDEPHPVARGAAGRAPAASDHAQDQPHRDRPGLLRSLRPGAGRSRRSGSHRQGPAVEPARHARAARRHAYRPLHRTRRGGVSAPLSAGRRGPHHRRAHGRSRRRALRSGHPADAAAGLEPDRAPAGDVAARALLRAELSGASSTAAHAGRPRRSRLPALRVLPVRRRMALRRSYATAGRSR